MARFFRKKARSSRRGFFKRSSKSSSGVSPMGMMIGGAIYGVGRETVASFIPQSVTDMVPGGVGDEVAMGVLSYFMAKGTFGSNSTVKNIGRAGLAIEAYRITALTVGGTNKPKNSTLTYEY